MILNPAILALLVSSLLICVMVLYAAYYGIKIVAKWDIRSGSEQQLNLERRTYFVSTIVTYFLAIQIASLFLLIYTADSLHTLFSGTMCAVGTFEVDPFGFPTVLFKLATSVLAGIWLIVNHADNLGSDYPLIKFKYRFLIALTPVILVENVLQWAFFLGLHPDIITSCCGSLFSPGGRSIAGEIAGAPMVPSLVVFFTAIALTIASGMPVLLREKGFVAFAIASSITGIISIGAIISALSVYIYELPSHHCPFCILQPEYHYIGYLLYGAILAGTICGAGVGVLSLFRKTASLAPGLSEFLKLLTAVSVGAFFVLATAGVTVIVVSHYHG